MPEEVVKRLAPSGETLRELFLKSGNLCAFPGCGSLMMDADAVFIGQLCHIEAALEGGERFNPESSNELRRHKSNLMLMCYPHHQKTNDVSKYSVSALKQMKADHENRFSHPDRAILDKLSDWTLATEPTRAVNLQRINQKLNWGSSKEELSNSCQELDEYINKLRLVPIEVRQFLGAVAKRLVLMSESNVTYGNRILVSDIEAAYRLSPSTVVDRLAQLESYGLAMLSEIDTGLGDRPAIALRDLKSGWPLWQELVLFCNAAEISLEVFTDDMDFGRLDN